MCRFINKKKAVELLQHGLHDFQIRMKQYFDHYLRGAPAPKWLTEGVPYIAKETLKEPK